ncbi:MAG: Hsp20/alpha crystallin family protein [Gammaproteobacteria bacterium]|nr:Hsp20/alpha crystallin family protein [Gammaproteobacteria bacterium]
MATQVPVKKQEGKSERLLNPANMLEEMERWAEELFPRRWGRPLPVETEFWRSAMPQVDIIERDDEIEVHAAVAGFNKSDLEISATDAVLTIRGTRKSESKEDKGDYFRREIRAENFMRSIRLPALVDDAKAKATIKDGMLEVVLPKKEVVERHKLSIEEG